MDTVTNNADFYGFNFDDPKQTDSLKTTATTATTSSSSGVHSPSDVIVRLRTAVCSDQSLVKGASQTKARKSGQSGAIMSSRFEQARLSDDEPYGSDSDSTASGDSSRRADADCSAGGMKASPSGSTTNERLDGDDGGDQSVKRKRRPRPPVNTKLDCAVCGDTAFGYNFDAVTCESCKAFFRRNALRQHVCQNGNQCKIDKESRKYCSSCRLTKCLDVGMKRELILSPAKLEKRAKLVRKKKRTHHPSDGSTSTCGSQSAAGITSTPSAQAQTSFASSRDSQMHTPVQSCEKTERLKSNRSSGASSYVSCVRDDVVKCEPDDPPYSNMSYSADIKSNTTRTSSSAVSGAAEIAPSELARKTLLTNPGVAQYNTTAISPKVQCLAMNNPADLSPCTELSQSDYMMAEMARLGLDVSAVTNAASSLSAADAAVIAQQLRGIHALKSPVNTKFIKQEQTDSLSPSSNTALNRPGETTRTISSMPTVDYPVMLNKCLLACEQLLRPLNASDMRQMRPASDAYEQFNYGELFVRRFVNGFKQISDFRSLGQSTQLKLLRSSMVSTLNIAGVFSFDVSRQAWVLQEENHSERVYLISDMIALFESSGQTHIRDYMRSYCEFHTRLRNEFGNDVVLYLVLILIDMFSPHRFTTDRDMLALLVPAHARYVQFLELYLAVNYGTKQQSACADSQTQGQGALGALLGLASPDAAAAMVVPQPGAPLEPPVKQKFDFCLEMLSNARTLEEYLAITSQYIGLTAMLPLLAEVCEYQLKEWSDTE